MDLIKKHTFLFPIKFSFVFSCFGIWFDLLYSRFFPNAVSFGRDFKKSFLLFVIVNS